MYPKMLSGGLSRMLDHLVFKFLSGNERVEEVDAIFPLEGNDLAACAANVGVDIECLLKMIDGRGPWQWHGTL